MIIQSGLYKHYKGGVYKVFCTAIHTETFEDMVVYRNSDRDIWVRPASMWNELVDTSNGKVPRFTKIEIQNLLTPNMREETSEEQKAVEDYLKKISKPTDENFWDLIAESEES